VIAVAVARAPPLVPIDTRDVRALLGHAQRCLTADSAAAADDGDDAARQLFLRRHALQLGFLEQPIFDVERFLERQCRICIDGFRAAHHLNGAGVELGRDARLALVLAPRDHAQARDQDDRRVRVAHGGRVRVLVPLVVGRVVLMVLVQPGEERALERVHVLGLRIPRHVERFDLGAEEVVGAGGAQRGQARGVVTVDEAQDGVILLHRADEAPLLAHPAAEPRQDVGEYGGAARLRQ